MEMPRKTKPIIDRDYRCKVTTIYLSPEDSRKVYDSLCEGIQEAAREAMRTAPNSNGLCLRVTE